MPNRNKQRGYELEHELEVVAKAEGLDAIRAYGSNGRAIGETQGVDLRIAKKRIQAKRHKKFPLWLQVPEGADYVVFREDYAKPVIQIPFIDWCKLKKIESLYEELINDQKNKEQSGDSHVSGLQESSPALRVPEQKP